MAEVFKPRENMIYNEKNGRWECRDQNNNLVCDGGPSVIWDEGGIWLFQARKIGLHRLDGPVHSGGAWWINNINVTKEIHQFAQENNMNLDNLSDEDKVLIALKFS